MDSYHPQESLLFDCLKKSELIQEEWFIALRIILSKPLSYFVNNRKELFTAHQPGEVYKSDEFKSIYNLVSTDSM